MTQRDSQAVRHQAHNLKIRGSIPLPAPRDYLGNGRDFSYMVARLAWPSRVARGLSIS